MPKQAHITPAILGHAGNGLWAIDTRFPLHAAMQQLAHGRELHAMSDDTHDDLRRALKETDGFTSYLNPDGSMVSSLDEDASERILPGAIAVVPIHGVMLKSCPNWYQYYGFTSTARAAADVANATTNERVAGIILNVYTPGGMVSGAEALSQVVKEASTKKPTITYVSDLCASAGVLATVHSRQVLLNSRTAEVGSIGTMATVVNDEEYWREIGIKWLDVYATESTEKNAAYTEAAAGKPEKMRAELDAINAIFLQHVREARASVVPQALTGAMFVGQQAIDAGLADGFATLEQTVALTRQEAEAANAVPDPTKEQRQQPQAMSFLTKMTALVASLKALFTEGTAPTAAELDGANAALKSEGITGVQLISDEQAATLGQAAELQVQLTAAQARATELEAQLATAQAAQATAEAERTAITTELEGLATAHNIAAEEGGTLTGAVLAQVKKVLEGTPSAHTGGASAEGNGKTAPKYNSLKAAEKDGIRVGNK